MNLTIEENIREYRRLSEGEQGTLHTNAIYCAMVDNEMGNRQMQQARRI